MQRQRAEHPCRHPPHASAIGPQGVDDRAGGRSPEPIERGVHDRVGAAVGGLHRPDEPLDPAGDLGVVQVRQRDEPDTGFPDDEGAAPEAGHVDHDHRSPGGGREVVEAQRRAEPLEAGHLSPDPVDHVLPPGRDLAARGGGVRHRGRVRVEPGARRRVRAQQGGEAIELVGEGDGEGRTSSAAPRCSVG
ncbi:hypothetical protein [Saccharothrix luteola]|uniref:hypothetical protein n=1 Tax=Saccharothrix luteola TaxID=2893018 RepID=UPI001E2E1987|nr:hypothetical protein [Saccharothrix luteola]MCC8242767.1 hypothetical protein [Saccharothrix luteola]